MSDMASGTPVPAGDEPASAELVPVPPQAAAPQAPASADMVQTVTLLDRAIKQRRDTDTTLINYWLYFFLVSWITFGIYGLVLFFKRINRIDRFGERKHAYYRALCEWTERYAAQQGKQDEVHHELVDLREQIDRAYRSELRPIKAGLSFLLTILTVGLFGFYVLYRMNRYWWDAQVLEQDIDDKLSQLWLRLDLMRYPISFTIDQGKRRSYPLYLVLSILTLGIWGVVWDYKVHTDPENLFESYHAIEDTVLQTVRAH